MKNVNTGYMIRAPTGQRTAQPLQLNRGIMCAPRI